ncbi:MAG: Cytochrome P450-pinF1, plant-inducible [Hyphomonas sp. TMED17]|nr:MAG: Cytochrome P450-pinF1, plant-inducible [Hyphomonas sp. TMED17]
MTKTQLKTLDDAPLAPKELIFGDSPYDVLRRMREKAPIARTDVGVTLALRNRHFELVTSDATRQIETETKLMQGITDGPIYDFTRLAMLFANGETHIRRRLPVARTFAFKLMQAMRPRIRDIAEDLIGSKIGVGPVDFVSDIASQFPARIIAEILGIPDSDVPTFLNWIQDTASALGMIDPTQRDQIEASLNAFYDYVADLLDQRRKNPQEDFVTEYVRKTAEAGNLGEDEIRTQLLGLILAGSDTTRGSICMILSELLQHPQQWTDLTADPDGLKRAAVEEGMRYQPLVSGIPRIAMRDIEIDGYLVPKGAVIAISIISALRDPEIFSEPDRFNIHRADQQRWHFGFGAGAHRCVGEALARAEMEEMLATIARMAPNTKLIGDPPILMPAAIRQVGPMTVAFEA